MTVFFMHLFTIKIVNANKHEYITLCMNAYNRVSDYTWGNYIDEFLNSLKKERIINE